MEREESERAAIQLLKQQWRQLQQRLDKLDRAEWKTRGDLEQDEWRAFSDFQSALYDDEPKSPSRGGSPPATGIEVAEVEEDEEVEEGEEDEEEDSKRRRRKRRGNKPVRVRVEDVKLNKRGLYEGRDPSGNVLTPRSPRSPRSREKWLPITLTSQDGEKFRAVVDDGRHTVWEECHITNIRIAGKKKQDGTEKEPEVKRLAVGDRYVRAGRGDARDHGQKSYFDRLSQPKVTEYTNAEEKKILMKTSLF